MYDSRDRLCFAIRRLINFSNEDSAAFRKAESAEDLLYEVLDGALTSGAEELDSRKDGLGPFEAFDFCGLFQRLVAGLKNNRRGEMLDTRQLSNLIGELPEALMDVAARAIERVRQAAYRKAKQHEQDHDEVPLEQYAQDVAGEGVAIPCANERVQNKKELLLSMPSFDREVVHLRLVHGLTQQQAADHLGVSRYAVMRAERRVRKRLQQHDARQECVGGDQRPSAEPQQSPKLSPPRQSPKQRPGKPRKDPKRAGDRDAGKQDEKGPDENHRGRSRRFTGAPARYAAVRVADRGRKQNKRPRRDPHPPVFLTPFSEHRSPRFPRPNHTASTRKGQIAMRVCAGWRRNIASRSAA